MSHPPLSSLPVHLMPALHCGSLFAQKVLLHLESLSPNPSNVAPVDVHHFFIAGVDEHVVSKTRGQMVCTYDPKRWENDFIEQEAVREESHKEEFVPADKLVSCDLSNQ